MNLRTVAWFCMLSVFMLFDLYVQVGRKQNVPVGRRRSAQGGRKQKPRMVKKSMRRIISPVVERKIEAVKHMGGKCIVCGYDRCDKSFDFHHLNPSKKDFELCDFWVRKNWEEILAELDKCILMCSNCHREYHAGMFCLLSDKPI